MKWSGVCRSTQEDAVTNAKKVKQQRAAGARKAPVARRAGGGSRSTWLMLAGIAAVVVVVAVAFSGGSSDPQTSASGDVSIARAPGPQLQTGEAVPSWSAPALDGSGPLQWDDAVGVPTVLAVWAPWCPHCQAELPRLSAALEDHPGVQLVTVATAIGEQPGPTPQEYLDGEGLTMQVAVDDGENTLMQGLGVGSFPTTYYVASDGTVLTATVGEVEPAELDRILTELEGR